MEENDMNEIKDIEGFADMVKERIVDSLPPDFAGSQVKITHTKKVNTDMTSLSVIPTWADDTLVPTIHLNKAYMAYQNGKDLDELLSDIANIIKESYDNVKDRPKTPDISHIDEDMIYFQLINTDSNKDLLESGPHREFHDMSIIYRLLYNRSEDGVESIRITNDLMDSWGVDEERLFELASENTKELFKPRIQTMNEVMMGFFGGEMEDMDPEMMDDLFESNPLWLVSNDICVNGATMMVYDDVLTDLANRMGDDLYILPSSLHEFLAVPVSEIDPSELSNMVQDINFEHVNEEDRLSNQVFSYDRNAHELNVAVANPIKGIKNDDFTMSKVAENIPFANYDSKPAFAL